MALNHIVQAILAHLTVVRAELIATTLDLSTVNTSLCIVTLAIDEISTFIGFTGNVKVKKPTFNKKEKEQKWMSNLCNIIHYV